MVNARKKKTAPCIQVCNLAERNCFAPQERQNFCGTVNSFQNQKTKQKKQRNKNKTKHFFYEVNQKSLP